jgi:hypothetical protein
VKEGGREKLGRAVKRAVAGPRGRERWAGEGIEKKGGRKRGGPAGGWAARAEKKKKKDGGKWAGPKERREGEHRVGGVFSLFSNSFSNF